MNVAPSDIDVVKWSDFVEVGVGHGPGYGESEKESNRRQEKPAFRVFRNLLAQNCTHPRLMQRNSDQADDYGHSKHE